MLSRMRRERGLTQAELARRLGMPQTALSRLERGHNPTFSTAQEVARALGAELLIVPREHLRAVDEMIGGASAPISGDEAPLIPDGEL